jgi:sulfite reductase (ferredoxin)
MAKSKHSDWMGWWEQGDGKLFYGQHVENGRVKDEGDFCLKTACAFLSTDTICP